VAEGITEPTPREREQLEAIDDVDLQIFAHKMDSVTDEARFVFERLAMAPALQIGDVATAVFTANGDMCSVATGIYFHAILNYGPIKYVRKHYMDDETVGLEPGDVFFFNEALAGAVHPYDQFMFMPVFHEGEHG
jgi:acetophenone carboxylase